MSTNRKTVATTSLAGCFGCHMSFLDIDERIFDLMDLVEFKKSPLNDIKTFTNKVDIGIVEGGCANSHNVEVLKSFRDNCQTLVSLGACAITGGVPAMRNGIPVSECLVTAFEENVVQDKSQKTVFPNDEEIPMILDRVYPCHEIVEIDYFIPGCAPRADLIWNVLTNLVQGKKPDLPYNVFKFD